MQLGSAQRGETAGSAPPATGFSEAEGWWARRDRVTEIVYWGIHASCLLVFWVGFSTADLVLLAATFYARMFGITGGYHRYFAHRTYKTSRAFQFVLALLGVHAPRRRGRSGGRRTTASTTSTRTSRTTCTRRAHGLLVGAHGLGLRAASTTTPTRRGSPTSRSTPSCAG